MTGTSDPTASLLVDAISDTSFEGSRSAAYLLSLASRPDRARAALARCAKVGIDPEVFVATTPEDLEALGFSTSTRINRAAAACTVSHRRILEDMIGRQLDHALVLEDDVLFSNDFPSQLAEVFRHLDPAFDLVQLGWLPGPDRVTLLQQVQHGLGSNRTLRRIANLNPLGRHQYGVVQDPLLRADFQYGTHCYLVSVGMAKMLCSSLGPEIYSHVDLHYRLYCQSNPSVMFRTKRSIATQDEKLGTDIYAHGFRLPFSLRRFFSE